MDTAQWPQEIVVKPIEEIVTKQPGSALERKARPQKEQALNCPRCNSTNTKFCYYNNYSLTQPRYFCKTCRRYWTEGGSLRNIPVGGGSRKNKRLSSSSSSSNNNNNNNNNSSKKLPDLIVTPNKIHHEGQDLNLAFPSSFSELIQVPSSGIESTNNDNSTTTSATTTTATATTTSQQLSALELLTGISSRGLNSFMPMPLLHQDPNFPLHHQDFKPSLNFSLDGIGNGYATLQETATGRLLFPFEDLKQVSTTTTSTDIDQQNDNREHGDSISAGYWTGMLGGSGGGGSW